MLYHRGHIRGDKEAFVISEGKVWWNSVKAALFVVPNQCSQEGQNGSYLTLMYICS